MIRVRGWIGLGTIAVAGGSLFSALGAAAGPPDLPDPPPGFFRLFPGDSTVFPPPLARIGKTEFGVSAPSSSWATNAKPMILPPGWHEPVVGSSSGARAARGARSAVEGASLATASAVPGVPVRVTPVNYAQVMTPNIANGGVPATALRVQFVSNKATSGDVVGSWYTQAGKGPNYVPPANRVWVQKTTSGSVLSSTAFGNGTYEWFSQACTGTDGTGCSSIQSTVDQFSVVIAPALVSPAVGSTLTSTSVTLTIKDGPGTPWYHAFRVAPHGQLNTASMQSSPTGTTGTSYTFNGLNRGQQYDWAAQSCTAPAGGCTSQLFVGTFTIANPSVPTLTAPAPGEITTSTTPTLRITDPAGLSWPSRRYQLYKVVNGTAETTTTWAYDSPSDMTAVTTPVLALGTTYEWTAATCTGVGSGCTAFAPRQRFTVGAQASLPVGLTIGTDCDNALGSKQCEAGDGAASTTGDPVVDSQNAGLAEQTQDFSLDGRGYQLNLSRSYASVDNTVGRFGAGWSFNLAVSATLYLNGDVGIRAEDGQTAIYVKQADGSLKRPDAVTSTLAAVAGGGWKLTRADLSRVYTFDSQGRLTNIVDESGQGITLTYNAASDLLTAKNAENKSVSFTTDPTSHLVSKVSLPGGRSINYTYYSNTSRLQTVTDMTGTVSNGNAITYFYDGSGRLNGVQEQITGTVTRMRENVQFNAAGQVISSTDAEDKTTTYSWTGSTTPPLTGTKTTTDPRGNSWSETYDGGHLVKTTNPYGKTHDYAYDSQDNLVREVDENGNVTSMTYDTSGNMLTKTSPGDVARVEVWEYFPGTSLLKTYTNARGFATNYTYNTSGQVLTETNALGGVTTYTYTAEGQVATVKDARNNTTWYTYYPSTDPNNAGRLKTVETPLGHVSGKVTTTTYDALGRVATVTDPNGGVTTTGYDNLDRVVSVTDARGNTSTTTYDGAGRTTATTDRNGKVTAYTYDKNDRVLTVTDPNGGVTTTHYDDAGNVDWTTTPLGKKTAFEYDQANRLIIKTTPRGFDAGAVAADYQWTYQYDANGNQTVVTDPLGNSTTTIYNAANEPVEVRDPLWSSQEATAHMTRTEYDANGNVTATVDQIGRRSTTKYDALDQAIEQTSPLGNTTVTTYDLVGNTIAELTPLGNKTTWTYDNDNRQATMVEARGNVSGGTPGNYTWTYGYDWVGNKTSEKDPLAKTTLFSYDKNNNQISKTDPLSHATRWMYDKEDRLAAVIGPDTASCGTTGANCIGTATTDASPCTPGLSGCSPTGTLGTQYTFDGNGNILKITDPLDHKVRKTFDLDNQLLTTRTPRQQTNANPGVVLTYTSEGQVKTKTTARGGMITNTFDRRGGLTSVTYSDGTPQVQRSYDAAGRLKSMTDGAGTENYTLDDVGRRLVVDRSGRRFEYVYDDEDHVLGRTFPDADSTYIAYQFDNDGRMTNATNQLGATTTFTHDAAGNLATSAFPNGYTESRTYDTAGRLTRVRTIKASNSAVLVDVTNTLDAVGNPTKQAVLRGTTTKTDTFAYDVADRLTRNCVNTTSACTSSLAAWTAWTYDRVGNRLTQVRQGLTNPGTTSYTYDESDELTSTTGVGASTFTYDADGNQITAGSTTYQYDSDNMMTTATVAGTATTFTYDGNGARLTRTVGTNAPNRTWWDTNWSQAEMAIEENGATLDLVRMYTQGPLGPNSVTMGSGVGAYYHPDPLGSIRATTSAATTTPVEYVQWNYDPFGQLRDSAVVTGGGPTSWQLFAGEQWDSDTSLYHLRARQYNAPSGRFLGADPRTPMGASSYAYSWNSPLAHTDPSGEWPIGGYSIGRSWYSGMRRLSYFDYCGAPSPPGWQTSAPLSCKAYGTLVWRASVLKVANPPAGYDIYALELTVGPLLASNNGQDVRQQWASKLGRQMMAGRARFTLGTLSTPTPDSAYSRTQSFANVGSCARIPLTASANIPFTDIGIGAELGRVSLGSGCSSRFRLDSRSTPDGRTRTYTVQGLDMLRSLRLVKVMIVPRGQKHRFTFRLRADLDYCAGDIIANRTCSNVGTNYDTGKWEITR